LFGGIALGQPIITVPIKIHLANNPTLGPNCFIGSDQDPILLNPQNNDLSNAKTIGAFFSWDPSGVPDVTGPDGGLLITGIVQGDDTFAVPGATGCGPGGSLDAAVDAVAGVPSPSGSNHLVLADASSSLAFPQNSEDGQAFANDWHTAFGTATTTTTSASTTTTAAPTTTTAPPTTTTAPPTTTTAPPTTTTAPPTTTTTTSTTTTTMASPSGAFVD
jgi:hypothetical protein